MTLAEKVGAPSDVPAEILTPRHTRRSKVSYDATARKLAGLFRDNFTKYADGASAVVRAAGPVVNCQQA